MTKTNIYVDEHIAIEYSVEYEFHAQPQFSYSLSRGNKLMCVLTWSREDWEWHKQSTMLTVSQPKPDHPDAPTDSRRSEQFAYKGFQGDAEWWSLISPKGKLLMAGANLFLQDGLHWIHLRFDDHVEITEEVIRSLLDSISFPGQTKYEAAANNAQDSSEFSSPFAVELSYFSTFGIGEADGPKKYNFRYNGEELEAAQRKAIDQFRANEPALFDEVLDLIYEYYTEEELPVLEDILPEGLLPEPDSSEDMLQYLMLSGIEVHSPRASGDVPIGLSFEASWTDNDVGVRIVGESVEEVGDAYVALEGS